MTRARQEFVPNIPHSVDDVVIEDTWGETWSGDDYLLHQDNGFDILIFTTTENLRCLRKCAVVYMDGFFTMHGKYRNRVILFASCLTTGKNIGQYKQILQTLKRRIRQETGHGWRPTRVIFDYEQSLIAAVQTELPNSQVSGCYFHITKALWRHIQTLGMSVS